MTTFRKGVKVIQEDIWDYKWKMMQITSCPSKMKISLIISIPITLQSIQVK